MYNDLYNDCIMYIFTYDVIQCYTIITHYIHIDTEILILAGNFRLGKQEPTIYFHGGLAVIARKKAIDG